MTHTSPLSWADAHAILVGHGVGRALADLFLMQMQLAATPATRAFVVQTCCTVKVRVEGADAAACERLREALIAESWIDPDSYTPLGELKELADKVSPAREQP